jgi:transposase
MDAAVTRETFLTEQLRAPGPVRRAPESARTDHTESRENHARLCCVACGYQANAGVNAAKNILALRLLPWGGGQGLGYTRR